MSQECRLVPLTPSQPPPRVEEGESALASQTFQTTAFALSPANVVHFFDTASRIRRIDPNGRMTTVAGAGARADATIPGPARETPLAAVSQILFSPDGVLYFSSLSRVFRVMNGRIEAFAGSGRPGFNGEAGPALDMNLGTIVNMAFDNNGSLLLIDGYQRLRKIDANGLLRTIAGSTRAAASTGFTGDNGPATEASLSSPRQVAPFADGSLWIKDFSGRHLRLLRPDGIIRTINANFEPTVNILMGPDRAPLAGTANRLYPIRANGSIEIGAAPYAPFTGTPLGIGSDRAVYFLGNARPEQRNPLVRLEGREQTVVAGAPVVATVDGQAPPYGVWYPRTNSLLYASSLGGKFGILEARQGGAARFIAGGGTDAGDVDGKAATGLALFAAVPFTVDGEDRIVIADPLRRRILVVGADGKTRELKRESGEPVIYAPLGTFASIQRIAADREGNIYWYSQGATPTGGVFTAEISVWIRANGSVNAFTVMGLNAVTKLEDGSVAVIAGNGANFRNVYRVSPAGVGDPITNLRLLPLQSFALFRGEPYFTGAARLFRGEPGGIEMLDNVSSSSGATVVADFVLASSDAPLVHLTDGGFYRLENASVCKSSRQPVIAPGGVVNAASFGYTDTVSPGELITVFGAGLGPPDGQGMVLDGTLRAGSQPAPFPTLTMGNFTGAIPFATLTGTALPVLYSNDTQMTVQAPISIPASGEYLLYIAWQGLQVIYPVRITVQTETPGIFENHSVAVAINEDGSVHGSGNAAPAGSVVQVYATGLGTLDPPVSLGTFASANALSRITSTAVAMIGGKAADVLYAGSTPGQIGGLYQINVRIPEGLMSGPHQFQIQVHDQLSKPVTIYVR